MSEEQLELLKKKRKNIMIKAIIAVVFFAIEGIPTFVDSVGRNGVTLFNILEFISTPLSVYVIISLVVAIYTKTKSIKITIISVIVILLLSLFFDNKVKGMIFMIAMIVIFIPVAFHDIKVYKQTLKTE